jgi:hypothetical protein
MTEELKQSITPEERLSTAFGRFFLHVNNLQVFYATTSDSLDVGKNHVEQKVLKISKEEFSKPEAQQLFGKDNPVLQDKALFTFMVQAFARRSVRLSRQIAGSATIVFAHTVLDELLSECCLISFQASSSDWYPFVARRTVELGDLQGETPKTLWDEKAQTYVCQLSRESMVKRLNLLNQVCMPKVSKELRPQITGLMNMKKLEMFDGLRQRIIHDKPFAQKIAEIQEELVFVLVIGIAAMLTVGSAYDLFKKEKFKGDSILFKMVAEMQDEIPELKALIESLTKAIESLTQVNELIKKFRDKPKEGI